MLGETVQVITAHWVWFAAVGGAYGLVGWVLR